MRTVEEVAYHRNGVAGEGFHVVKFMDDDGEPMLGIVFGSPDAPSNPRVAVLNREMLAEGNITFGENSWRGDQYASFLYYAIAEHHVYA